MGDGGAFQSRDDRTQGIVLVLRMGGRGVWIAHDVQLVRLQHPRKRIKEQAGVGWRPQVHVNGVEPVQAVALVVGVGGGEMPLRGVVGGCYGRAGEGIDGDGEETRVLVRMLNFDRVQWAGEGVLAGRAGVVRNLDAGPWERGVVEEVDIGALVEAVVRRQVVVHVGEAGVVLAGT